MPAENTEAIVLRLVEFSETSLVVSLLTRDFGRISVIAKGARRPKAPFEGAIDLLAISRVMVIRKPNDTLGILTEAKLIRRFRAGEKDLPRLYAGYYLIELLKELTDEGDPQPEIFDLAKRVQEKLHSTDDIPLLMTWTESQLLRMTGHTPLLNECVVCGQNTSNSLTNRLFSLALGGIVCDTCRVGHQGLLTFSETARRTWAELADKDEWGVPADWEASICAELRNVSIRWLTHVVGHRLRMFDHTNWQRPLGG